VDRRRVTVALDQNDAGDHDRCHGQDVGDNLSVKPKGTRAVLASIARITK
jgi:hypothetical protein